MNIERFLDKARGRNPGIMDSRGDFSVLLLLVKVNGEYNLLYEVRSDHIDSQPGEVCFPGGAMEPGESPGRCAMRETWEELGITSDMIDVSFRLDTFHPACGIVIRPFVGILDPRALERLKPNPDEVKEVFLVPLRELRDPLEYTYPAIRQLDDDFPFEEVGITRDYKWRNIMEELVLYRHSGHAIWGFTALMTRSLMKLIEKYGEEE